MKFQRLITLTIAGCSLLLASCDKPRNPPLVAPAENHASKVQNGSGFKIEFKPEVDILFVFDDSESMIEERDKLTENIGKFVDGIAKNKLIDYHIGVTTVYDTNPDRSPETPFFSDYAMGELQPLKNPLNSEELAGKRYVTKTSTYPGFQGSAKSAPIELLKSSLRLDIRGYEEDGGPVYEESLSPIKQALESSELHNGANKEFLRPNAHLVIVILTDAPDSSPDISAKGLYNDLYAKKKGNFSIYAALADEHTCPVSGPETKYPTEIVSLIQNYAHPYDYNNHIFGICSELYGEKLGKIGSDIRKNVFAKEIILPEIPEVTFEDKDNDGINDNNVWDDIKVYYGERDEPLKVNKDWTYNPRNQSISLNPDIELEFQQGAGFRVEYTPVKLYNIRSGLAYENNGPE